MNALLSLLAMTLVAAVYLVVIAGGYVLARRGLAVLRQRRRLRAARAAREVAQWRSVLAIGFAVPATRRPSAISHRQSAITVPPAPQSLCAKCFSDEFPCHCLPPYWQN